MSELDDIRAKIRALHPGRPESEPQVTITIQGDLIINIMLPDSAGAAAERRQRIDHPSRTAADAFSPARPRRAGLFRVNGAPKKAELSRCLFRLIQLMRGSGCVIAPPSPLLG